MVLSDCKAYSGQDENYRTEQQDMKPKSQNVSQSLITSLFQHTIKLLIAILNFRKNLLFLQLKENESFILSAINYTLEMCKS